MPKFLNIAFASGSPFTLPMLEVLRENTHKTLNQINNTDFKYEAFNLPINFSLLITQPDYEHRGKIYVNKLAKWADMQKIPTFKPIKINKECRENPEILENIDVVVTASYGQIIGKSILKIPKFGWINWHPSDLPKYRGPSPVQYAILNGEENTALTWIQMDEGMDSGDILIKEKIQIQNDNFTNLIKKAVNVGRDTIFEAIQENILVCLGKKTGQKQNQSEATFTHFLTKEMGILDLKNENCISFLNKFRAFNEFPKVKIEIPELGLVRIDEVGEILKSENNKIGFVREVGKSYVFLQDGKIRVKKMTLPNGKQEIL